MQAWCQKYTSKTLTVINVLDVGRSALDPQIGIPDADLIPYLEETLTPVSVGEQLSPRSQFSKRNGKPNEVSVLDRKSDGVIILLLRSHPRGRRTSRSTCWKSASGRWGRKGFGHSVPHGTLRKSYITGGRS